MKVQMFAIYDSKAEAYLQPFFMQSRGMATRAFADAASDKQQNFCKHPGDYTLFHIGEFDDATANVVSFEAKISLGTALELSSRAQSEVPQHIREIKTSKGGVNLT